MHCRLCHEEKCGIARRSEQAIRYLAEEWPNKKILCKPTAGPPKRKPQTKAKQEGQEERDGERQRERGREGEREREGAESERDQDLGQNVPTPSWSPKKH